MTVVKVQTVFRKIREGRVDAAARGTAFRPRAGQATQLPLDCPQKLVEVSFAGCLLGGRERPVERREADRVPAPERERLLKEFAHGDFVPCIQIRCYGFECFVLGSVYSSRYAPVVSTGDAPIQLLQTEAGRELILQRAGASQEANRFT
jgi:hypothetical protein